MNLVSRRTALSLAALAATSSVALAQSGAEENSVEQNKGEGQSVTTQATENAVLFWHAVALELNAFDHSFVNTEAEDLPRAPGPTASARALGIIYTVLADSVLSAKPGARHKPFLKSVANAADIKVPDLFVGGAVSSIMYFIYNHSRHAHLIKVHEAAFIRKYFDPRLSEGENLESWRQGLAFGSDQAFREKWNHTLIMESINPKDNSYTPARGRHQPDPLNCNQGFYGQTYGRKVPPLVLTEQQVQTLVPAPPELTSEIFEEVRKLGKLQGDSSIPNRLPKQERIGLFWAYDGARFIGTPPRLYNQIIVEIALADRMDELELARLLGLCNIAMSDAGNLAWFAKYEHKYFRPIVGIREEGTDLDWKPLGSPKTNSRLPDPSETVTLDFRGDRDLTVQDFFLGGVSGRNVLSTERGMCDDSDKMYGQAAFTPNFPAYPSGHATFGAAAFHTLQLVRGERDATRTNPGALSKAFMSDELNGSAIDNFQASRRNSIIEKFATIDDLIKNNNDSRVHLGVHWRFDSEAGASAGIEVAKTVHSKIYR